MAIDISLVVNATNLHILLFVTKTEDWEVCDTKKLFLLQTAIFYYNCY